jgi:Matrixin
LAQSLDLPLGVELCAIFDKAYQRRKDTPHRDWARDYQQERKRSGQSFETARVDRINSTVSCRMNVSLLPSVVALLFVFATFDPVRATTVVPVPEQALIEDAVAIVTGKVILIESYWDAQQEKIFTHISLSIDEILKGEFNTRELVLKQVGGRISDLYSWVYGSPEFTIGEKVLVFLGRNSDGSLRVAHLFQGKFSIFSDTQSGDEFLYRGTPAGVQVLSAPSTSKGVAPQNYEIHALKDYKNRIRETVQKASQFTPQEPSSNIVFFPLLFSSQTEIQEKFTFLATPLRWFEPDSFIPVSILINSSGEPLTPTFGFDQVRAGLQAWSVVAGTNFRFQDAGFTTAVGIRFDGVNAVSFRDPLGQIGNPVSCSGTLAIGGGFFDPNQSMIVNGQEFKRRIDGDVVFNDGWEGCGFYENFANFAEVATHELGHVLGLGHSANVDATMSFQAHFDGRGASLRQDDLDGLRFIYPGTTLVINSLGSDKPSPQPLDTTIVFTANASGGTAPIQYKWWMFNGTVWSILRDWSTGNTFNWTPTTGGSYIIAFWARSSGNNTDAAENNLVASINFTITAPPPLSITSLTADRASPQAAGTTIVATATASGGAAPIQFKWWIFNGTVWSVGRDWSTGNTFSWTPTIAGDYRIGVWARSNGNPVDAAENNALASINFTITAPAGLVAGARL